MIPQDYFDYPHPKNWYALSWFEHYRPDIEFITFADWPSYTEYEWLDQRIEQALAKKRTVAIVPWDEDTMHPVVPGLAEVLNKYSYSPVFWLSFLDPESQLIYRFQHGITCKIEEFPWYQANECFLYLHTHPEITPLRPGPHDFACMVARATTNKYQLIKEVNHAGLRSQGLVTVAEPDDYPDDVLEYADLNPNPPYINTGNIEPDNDYMGLKVTGNTLNFALLDQHYSDIPLFINAETTTGAFFMTEKGFWPIMLGRLLMVHARPRYMQYLQRFYSINLADIMDLTFDHIDGWTENDHQRRATVMLRSNLNFIKQARSIVATRSRDLAHARQEFPRRLWDVCIQTLKKLP